jgi:UDP-N-acetylglucosamine 4-epimerase
VTGLDDFSSGHPANLAQVKGNVGPGAWRNFRFVEGDIRSLESCREACRGVELVLHQAALCSVPHSIQNPLHCHAINVTGFVNMLIAARDAGVERLVYAGSSATYGDDLRLPQLEAEIGRPLSPYGLTKYVDELYAQIFARCYGLSTIGLRYFNVFGPRQDPASQYAAAVPLFITQILRGESPTVFGDGEQSRDFTYVANVVEANLLACTAAGAAGGVFNIACADRITVNTLIDKINGILGKSVSPIYEDPRPGDIKHSFADISAAERGLGYRPSIGFEEGLKRTISWYQERMGIQ